MAVKFEIHTIHNAKGEGGEQKFVQLRQESSIGLEKIEQYMEESSTVNAADVRAVMACMHRLVIQELSQGHRFHIPGIGYLSLTAKLRPSASGHEAKITGKDVFLRGINFQPEESLLKNIGREVRFKKSKYSTRSRLYTPENLWNKLSVYLAEHKYATVRTMSIEFGLSDYMSRKWLSQFVSDGKLKKEGTRRNALYFLV